MYIGTEYRIVFSFHGKVTLQEFLANLRIALLDIGIHGLLGMFALFERGT